MKYLFSLVAFCGLLGSLLAQPAVEGGNKAKPGLLGHFAAELSLSEQQQTQLAVLHQATRTRLESLTDQTGLSEAEQCQQRHEIRRAARAEAEAILSPEQQEKLGALAAARRAEHDGPGRAHGQDHCNAVDRAALSEALKNYHQENILPVKQTARAKLEPQLSVEDRAEIARLRAVMATRPRHEAGQTGPTGVDHQARHQALQQLRKTWREDHQPDLARLQALADRYATAIDEARAELTAAMPAWQADLQEIRSKYLPEGFTDRRAAHRAQHPHEQWSSADEATRAAQKLNHQRRHFLLLEPTASARAAATTTAAAASTFSVSPNPASGQVTLALTVATEGKISISLVDPSGRPVRKIADRNFSAGQHLLNLDVSGLAAGRYQLALIDATGPQSLTLIVNQ